MKYTFLGFGLIMAGLFGVVFIVMFESITINNESEYYVLKEAMEASMLESIDLDCYRNSEIEGCGGVVKISEQKFVENFTRRFTASVSGDVSQYDIQFYDIIETPPKASVVIKGLTGNYEIMASDGEGNFNITNSLTGILEHKLFADKIGGNNNNFDNSSLDITVDEGYTIIDQKDYYESVDTQDMCLGGYCNDVLDDSDTGDEFDAEEESVTDEAGAQTQ